MGAAPVKDLGPCKIIFNGVDLGASVGSVMFKFNTESRPVKEDQKGVTDVNDILVGIGSCSVEIPMSRTSLANLATVIPGASISSNLLTVNNTNIVGKSQYDSAQSLILKPIVDGIAGANTTWLTLLKAAPNPQLEVGFDNENQRIFKVIFKGYPDESTGKIWTIGA